MVCSPAGLCTALVTPGASGVLVARVDDSRDRPEPDGGRSLTPDGGRHSERQSLHPPQGWSSCSRPAESRWRKPIDGGAAGRSIEILRTWTGRSSTSDVPVAQVCGRGDKLRRSRAVGEAPVRPGRTGTPRCCSSSNGAPSGGGVVRAEMDPARFHVPGPHTPAHGGFEMCPVEIR